MDNRNITVKVINKSDNPLPSYMHIGDSGMDLHANESKFLFENVPTIIKTGIYVAIPEGFELQIRSRSGLALNNGIFVLNQPGTIDSGYRDEIGVILYTTVSLYQINKGDRIAQAVLCPIYRVVWESVDVLPESSRNLGGFGSTGK